MIRLRQLQWLSNRKTNKNISVGHSLTFHSFFLTFPFGNFERYSRTLKNLHQQHKKSKTTQQLITSRKYFSRVNGLKILFSFKLNSFSRICKENDRRTWYPQPLQRECFHVVCYAENTIARVKWEWKSLDQAILAIFSILRERTFWV